MRVFVSSTFRDLAPYREVLRLALEKSGHVFLGMEHFAAQDSPSLEVCLEELNTADVYLGLIGTAYGSSPPDNDLSYTELEYMHARQREIPCIILIISHNAQVRVGDVDTDQARNNRLAQFRQTLMNQHTIDRFKSEHEAAWRALGALNILEARIRESAMQGVIQ